MSLAGDEPCKHGRTRSACHICIVLRPQGRVPSQKVTPSGGRRTPANSATYFGHTWPEWHEMVDAGAVCLIGSARRRQTMPYGQVWDGIGASLQRNLGNRWRAMTHLLEHISERTFEGVGLDRRRAPSSPRTR